MEIYNENNFVKLGGALRSGNLGVMDYYKMQNVLADTAMKNNVGNTDLTKMFKDQEEKPTI